MVDDLTALAARYHRDKLDRTLHYPREFISGPGVTRDAFDYFPEHHYREAFERMRNVTPDEVVDEWTEAVVGKEPVGCEHGGLWRDDVPDLVEDILTSSQRYETEITIRPEAVEGYDYVVEWEYIEFDPQRREWTPVREREGDG